MKSSTVFLIFSALLVAFNSVLYLFHLGGDAVLKLVSDLLPIASALAATIALFAAFRAFRALDFAKVSWLLLLIGIVLYLAAEVTYAVLELALGVDMDEVFPTLADAGWLAGYLPLFAGLVVIFRGYLRSGFPMGRVRVYGLLAAALVLAAGAVFYKLLIPIVEDPEESAFAKFVYLFYPIGDLFLIAPAMLMMYVTSLLGKGRLSRPWRLIALGFVSLTIADIIYSYLSWIGEYGDASMIDVAWNVGYLLIGLGALTQRELIASFATEAAA